MDIVFTECIVLEVNMSMGLSSKAQQRPQSKVLARILHLSHEIAVNAEFYLVRQQSFVTLKIKWFPKNNLKMV